MKKHYAQNTFNWGGAKTLGVTDLPPFMISDRRKTSSQVAQYFQRLFSHSEMDSKRCLFLPSVSSLARHLDVLPEDIREALSLLKEDGYDNFAGGMYGHITLWSSHL